MRFSHNMRGRTVILGSMHSPITSDQISAPFAAMLASFAAEDVQLAERVVPQLVRLGCIEICCVGPESERTHDAVDCIVEDMGAIGVVTTWDDDVIEGCNYFVETAGGQTSNLLALVEDFPDVALSLARVTKQVTAQTLWSVLSSDRPSQGTRHLRSRRGYAERGSTAHQPTGSPSR
jgi:hypothetical protein